ncbi:5-guanidino-2-oxopentanoate decarboxylase [Streptomyces fractus]|uniref:5-guanidino-2-oxopentanoate decarboxylase n=1 Tax=Streptomyces fractus TaxID=641806 RepID=UPI003CF72480
MTHPLNGAAAAVQALRQNGVDTVFGIPGTHNLELYRHLATSGVRHIAPRHEQGAGYAADAYARVTGRAGVCITTSGPGLTNISTAAATAYADSIPMLVVSPAAPVGRERADVGWLHEVKDQRAHMDALLARSIRVSTPDEAVDAIHQAFARWRVERPRPVHLEVPVDVLEAPWTSGPDRRLPNVAGQLPVADSLSAATDALRTATAPLLLLGGGACDAAEEATRLAELLDSPVITTVNGKGVVPESHPLSVGATLSQAPVQEAVEAADVLLVVGSELAEVDTAGTVLAPRGTVVRVDIDICQLHKNVAAGITVHGPARQVLTELASLLGKFADEPSKHREPGAARATALRALAQEAALTVGEPWRRVQEILRACLPADAIVAGDSAQVSYSGTVPFWPMDSPRCFLHPTGYATLGYAIPAAIGAKVAFPQRTVCALAGDGGSLFSIQELATAAEHGLPIPIIIMNNHGYAEIREEMHARGIPPLAVDIRGIDFAALGRAFGGHGECIADLEHLPDAVSRALAADGPTVIEFIVDAPKETS